MPTVGCVGVPMPTPRAAPHCTARSVAVQGLRPGGRQYGHATCSTSPGGELSGLGSRRIPLPSGSYGHPGANEGRLAHNNKRAGMRGLSISAESAEGCIVYSYDPPGTARVPRAEYLAWGTSVFHNNNNNNVSPSSQEG
eukprot:5995775-Pyramimonas_sp.AAC.1